MSTTSISDALQRVGEIMTAEPAKAHTKGVPATARLVEGLRFEVTGPSGESALTDMPTAMGGASSAPAPAWLLRAAIASCTASVIAMRAAQTGVQLTTLEATVESEVDQRGMLGLGETSRLPSPRCACASGSRRTTSHPMTCAPSSRGATPIPRSHPPCATLR